MPIYIFTNDDETIVHEELIYGGAHNPELIPDTIVKDGHVLERNVNAEHRKHKKSTAKWPMRCDASGVSDNKIPEINEEIRAHNLTGVRCVTEGEDKGCMEYDSPGERHKYLRFSGLKDRSSWYG